MSILKTDNRIYSHFRGNVLVSHITMPRGYNLTSFPIPLGYGFNRETIITNALIRSDHNSGSRGYFKLGIAFHDLIQDARLPLDGNTEFSFFTGTIVIPNASINKTVAVPLINVYQPIEVGISPNYREKVKNRTGVLALWASLNLEFDYKMTIIVYYANALAYRGRDTNNWDSGKLVNQVVDPEV